MVQRCKGLGSRFYFFPVAINSVWSVAACRLLTSYVAIVRPGPCKEAGWGRTGVADCDSGRAVILVEWVPLMLNVHVALDSVQRHDGFLSPQDASNFAISARW